MPGKRICGGGIYRDEDEDEWDLVQGTAFVVSADGVLATSAHVFADDVDLQALAVIDAKGTVYPIVAIEAIDELRDTCLFRIEASNLRPLPLGRDVPPGARIRVVGHPGDSYYYLSSGVVSNYEVDDDENRWLNVTADLGQGSSGAPVLDSNGNVVGLVSRTSTLFAGPDESAAAGRARRTYSTPHLGAPGSSARSKSVRQPAREFRWPGKRSFVLRDRPHHEPHVEPHVEPHREMPTEPSSEPPSEPPSEPQFEPQMVFRWCVPIEVLRQLLP